MKKIIVAAFIAFSIVSCSNDDDSPEKISGINSSNIVEVSFGNSFLQPNKKSGKPVDRGSIPVMIDTIKVNAHNKTLNTDNLTTFDLLAKGTVGAETKFKLDGVAAGNNVFTATAKTNGSAIYEEQITDDTTASGLFNGNYRNSTPYANYLATDSRLIDAKTNYNIAFVMGTSNGKINTYIYTGPVITASMAKVTITSQRFNAMGQAIDTASIPQNISGINSYVSSWNNDDALDKAYLRLIIKVYDDEAGTNLVYTNSTDIKIAPSKTINTTISVNKSGITSTTTDATFTFPNWDTEDNIQN